MKHPGRLARLNLRNLRQIERGDGYIIMVCSWYVSITCMHRQIAGGLQILIKRRFLPCPVTLNVGRMSYLCGGGGVFLFIYLITYLFIFTRTYLAAMFTTLLSFTRYFLPLGPSLGKIKIKIKETARLTTHVSSNPGKRLTDHINSSSAHRKRCHPRSIR